jgi:hypothetical protein
MYISARVAEDNEGGLEFALHGYKELLKLK